MASSVFVQSKPLDQGTAAWLPQTDHLVYAVPALAAGLEALEDTLGVSAVAGGRHPGYGTHNALIALGPEAYLEIIAPDPERADPALPTLFGLDRLKEPRLVTWAVRADLEAGLEIARGQGVPLGSVGPGSRTRPDGVVLSWRFTDPYAERLGGVIPFLIDWGATPHPAGTLPQRCALVGLRAEHPETRRVEATLRGLGVALPVVRAQEPALVATLHTPRGLVGLR